MIILLFTFLTANIGETYCYDEGVLDQISSWGGESALASDWHLQSIGVDLQERSTLASGQKTEIALMDQGFSAGDHGYGVNYVLSSAMRSNTSTVRGQIDYSVFREGQAATERWLQSHGSVPKIVNMSMSLGGSETERGLRESVSYLHGLDDPNRGEVITVVSAGNNGDAPISENSQDFNHVLVGALNLDGLPADYSQGIYSDEVDVWVPVDYELLVDTGSMVGHAHGTSYAAPIVSGVLGDLAGFIPDLSRDEANALLRATSVSTVHSDGANRAGMLNAPKLLAVGEILAEKISRNPSQRNQIVADYLDSSSALHRGIDESLKRQSAQLLSQASSESNHSRRAALARQAFFLDSGNPDAQQMTVESYAALGQTKMANLFSSFNLRGAERDQYLVRLAQSDNEHTRLAAQRTMLSLQGQGAAALEKTLVSYRQIEGASPERVLEILDALKVSGAAHHSILLGSLTQLESSKNLEIAHSAQLAVVKVRAASPGHFLSSSQRLLSEFSKSDEVQSRVFAARNYGVYAPLPSNPFQDGTSALRDIKSFAPDAFHGAVVSDLARLSSDADPSVRAAAYDTLASFHSQNVYRSNIQEILKQRWEVDPNEFFEFAVEKSERPNLFAESFLEMQIHGQLSEAQRDWMLSGITNSKAAIRPFVQAYFLSASTEERGLLLTNIEQLEEARLSGRLELQIRELLRKPGLSATQRAAAQKALQILKSS